MSTDRLFEFILQVGLTVMCENYNGFFLFCVIFVSWNIFLFHFFFRSTNINDDSVHFYILWFVCFVLCPLYLIRESMQVMADFRSTDKV